MSPFRVIWRAIATAEESFVPPAAPAFDREVLVRFAWLSKHALALLFLGALPLGFLGVITFELVTGSQPFDFHTFWASGQAVLHGESPYPTSLPAVAERTEFRPFVYPAPAAVAMVPFAVLPETVAIFVWFAVGVAALFLALRLLGVDDWRCYGAAFASVPVCSSLSNGAISTLLVLALAALWRYRARPWVAGALLAALVVFKLYLWPLGVWLLATRRFGAAWRSVVLALAATVAGWAAIGFAGLREYPHLLDRLTGLVGDSGYAPYALFRSLGASPGAARAEMLACGAILLSAVFALARRRGGDHVAFTLAIAASLTLSPVVWPHYLALVYVPLAIARPRLSAAWLVPFAYWLMTSDWSDGHTAIIAGTLAVTGTVLVGALAASRWPDARRAAARLAFAAVR
jgi:hypothetical protein